MLVWTTNIFSLFTKKIKQWVLLLIAIVPCLDTMMNNRMALRMRLRRQRRRVCWSPILRCLYMPLGTFLNDIVQCNNLPICGEDSVGSVGR